MDSKALQATRRTPPTGTFDPRVVGSNPTRLTRFSAWKGPLGAVSSAREGSLTAPQTATSQASSAISVEAAQRATWLVRIGEALTKPRGRSGPSWHRLQPSLSVASASDAVEPGVVTANRPANAPRIRIGNFGAGAAGRGNHDYRIVPSTSRNLAGPHDDALPESISDVGRKTSARRASPRCVTPASPTRCTSWPHRYRTAPTGGAWRRSAHRPRGRGAPSGGFVK